MSEPPALQGLLSMQSIVIMIIRDDDDDDDDDDQGSMRSILNMIIHGPSVLGAQNPTVTARGGLWIPQDSTAPRFRGI